MITQKLSANFNETFERLRFVTANKQLDVGDKPDHSAYTGIFKF